MKNLFDYTIKPIHSNFETLQISDTWKDVELEEKTEIHMYFPAIKSYTVYFIKSIYAKEYIESEYTVKVVYHFESIIEVSEEEEEGIN